MIPVDIDLDGRPYESVELELTELPTKGEVVEFPILPSVDGPQEPGSYSGRVLTVTKQFRVPSDHPNDQSKRILQRIHIRLETVLHVTDP